MVVGVGRRVKAFEQAHIPSEKLTRGHRIVEDNRLIGVVTERIVEPFGGCRHNIHVRVATANSRAGEPIPERLFCYSGGTTVTIVD
jgi:hypothetical protein